MKVTLGDMFAVGMVATEEDFKEYPKLRECKSEFIRHGPKWIYTDSERVKNWIEEMSKIVDFRSNGETQIRFKELRSEAHYKGWQIDLDENKPKGKQIKMF